MDPTYAIATESNRGVEPKRYYCVFQRLEIFMFFMEGEKNIDFLDID